MSLDALFQPLTIGSLPIPNRVVMAPLTRARADATHVPAPIQGEYYAQRAGRRSRRRLSGPSVRRRSSHRRHGQGC
ncbi:hypothetical protein [Sphingobium sp.]|uniref:oxidoreductase n=1 Tax=Sphingobium sp. TaxID=1912891 RepID=UPI0039C9AFD4